MNTSPDGTVQLKIERTTPLDGGAYKVLIRNNSGDETAMCAVAIIRKWPIFFKLCTDICLMIMIKNIDLLNSS